MLALFVLAVARSVKTDHSSPSASSSAPAKQVEEVPGTRALLDGIGVGDSVEGWVIESTRIDKEKRLAVAMQRGKTGFDVWITRKGATGGKVAPQQTDKYDFYVGEERVYGGPIPDGAQNKVLNAIVARVRRAENRAPVPAGL